MKLNSLEFKEYVIEEVKRIAEHQGWSENLVVLSENTVNILSENDFELIDPKEWPAPANGEEVGQIDIKKIKELNEELIRMRELVDFRNPFFSKD